MILFTGLALSSRFVFAADSLTDQLDEIKKKIKAYEEIITLKQRQGSQLSDQIESLQAQAESLQLQIDTNQKTIRELDVQVAILENRIGEKEAVIGVQKKVLSELMRSYYLDRSETTVKILTAEDNALNPFQNDEWTTQMSDKMRELLDTVKTLKESLVVEEQSVSAKRNNADSLRLQLAQRNEYLESTKSNKAVLLAKTQSDAQKYNALVDDLEKQREEIENEIESIESGKIDSLNLKDMPSFKHGLLEYPLKKFTLTQGYGKTSYAKRSGSYGRASFHNGLDFAAPTGTPVYAPANGKVVAVGNNGRYAYGRWIAIDHGNGIVTLYGHLSKQSVKRGESVDAGEIIGAVGSTGNSTGPHVHFSVFSARSFDVVASKSVSSVKDIPVGATVNPKVYLP
ncbi:MAG: peptidoglycan DD-metalloendopeptidase family protein [Candidatus Moraniibacteriota bacterium]